MGKRFLVLVIDGLGVGEMEDVRDSRPQDRGANTLKHVVEANPEVTLTTLDNLGILSYYNNGSYTPLTYKDFNLSLGRAKLAHFGADSFMGHQEIAGTNPKAPIRQFVRDNIQEILEGLKFHGLKGEFNGRYIVIDEHIAIADNIETDYGLNINVVGSLDHYDYCQIEKVGRVVRGIVKVGRVITMGGTGISSEAMKSCFEIKERDGFTAWGINIPKLGIYNDDYRVIHMGFGVDETKQVSSLAVYNKIDVTLIGKAADVIVCNGATFVPEVQTLHVLNHIESALRTQEQGFIFANVQQTDLAGHEMDPKKYLQYLSMVDTALPRILSLLRDEDVMIITGDHGNDPTIGHTNHTREYTPIILFSKKYSLKNMGTRKTLSDVGASVGDYFDLPSIENGKSVFST